MPKVRFPLFLLLSVSFVVLAVAAFPAAPLAGAPENADSAWTFAVSGDSRNCGNFVMPAIAARVKADNDAFYWHLGDFRWMSLGDHPKPAIDDRVKTGHRKKA